MPNTIYNTETIPPTYLCIKIHSATGLRYFCKTTRDPKSYKGSGTHWLRHIKKHGKEFVVNELVIGPYTNKSEIITLALFLSIELDVVNSKDWANLKLETGIDGGCDKGFRLGVPTTGGSARGVPKTGKKSKGQPATGNNAKGHIKTGKNAKGYIATGGKAKGVPNTGGKAKGVPNTGGSAKGSKQPIVTCPHCGISGGAGTMKRWHFDNCKMKSKSL